MRVEKREEPIQRELGDKLIVLPRQHLLAHSGPDLGREVQDRTETQVAALSALVVLAVLDATPPEDGVHASINVFVEVETLLGLGHAAAGRHEDAVQEVRMALVQLAANLGQRPGEERSKCLYFVCCVVV